MSSEEPEGKDGSEEVAGGEEAAGGGGSAKLKADAILARAEENHPEADTDSRWRALGSGNKLGDGVADGAAAEDEADEPAALGDVLDVRVTFFADGFTVEEEPGKRSPPEAAPAPRRSGIATLGDAARSAPARPAFTPPPLRDFQDPANADFLDALSRDEVPPSLRRTDDRGRPRRVRFGVADARHFKCPWGPDGVLRDRGAREGGGASDDDDDDDDPHARARARGARAPVAFQGEGHSLVAAAPASGATPAATGDEDLPPTPVFDDAKKKVVCQLRLHGGRRVAVKLNEDHTVGHLRRIVSDEGAATQNYLLLSGFPPAPLADLSATLGACGLDGASVQQKLC